MSLACTIHGIIGIDNGRAYQYGEKKRFWLHDGHLPMPDNDLSVRVMTFGGDPVPLDDGVYVVNGRIICAQNPETPASQPILQLFLNDVHSFDFLALHCSHAFSPGTISSLGR
jgi:hypothetical protein